MMTPDELRELADALDEATFKLLAAKHTGEAVSCMHAADYLRQQAHTHPAPAVRPARARRVEVGAGGADAGNEQRRIVSG